MITDVLKNAEERMQTSARAFAQDLTTIRTGRASPALVEHIRVDYAGAVLPINQLASVSVPEARLLVIHPWDKGSIANIEKAILKSELGLNPNTDGTVIRIAIPPLSEERRQELTKVVRKRIEERRMLVRNIRHEAMERLRKMEKDKEISQDEDRRAQEQLQKITDRFIAEVDTIGKKKEAELMEV